MEKFRKKFKILKNGFTLAEVLITLVIVGVVAAMTISVLINNIEKKHLIIGWRKSFSDVSRALLLAKANNDTFIGVSGDNMPQSISKYINSKPCVGTYKAQTPSYTDFNRDTNCLELENGVRLVFAGSGAYRGTQVNFDINNSRKPNALGKDIFCATLDKNEYKLYPGKGYQNGWGCSDGVIYTLDGGTVCNANDPWNSYACSAYYLLKDK